MMRLRSARLTESALCQTLSSPGAPWRSSPAQSLAYKRAFLYDCTGLDLGNLVRCALEAQTPPDTTDDASNPVLLVAAYNNSNAALKALLAGGANIELAAKSGSTALGAAAQKGHLSCVQLLPDAGANANTQDILGYTPLIIAVMLKQVECARALLPFSDLSHTGIIGHTAFHASISTASEACFEMLLPMVSDVDMRTVPGMDSTGHAMCAFNETALHLACDKGLPMCKALLSRGADRMARDSKQRTPLYYAAMKGHLSCIVLLVGRPGNVRMTPAEVDAVDGNGCTALHFAAVLGLTQVCAVLMGAGASLDAKTSRDGGTPLTAAQHYHPTNAALLALLSGDVPAQSLDLVCDQCGKTAEQASVKSLKTCRDCSAARYCSKECQLAAWPGHKAACKARVKEREEKTRIRLVQLPQESTS